MTDDICVLPDLRPKDEFVGHSADACHALVFFALRGKKSAWCLRHGVLFSTNVYRSYRLIQIDSVGDEIIIGGSELHWRSLYLVKRDNVWTLKGVTICK